MADTSSHMWRMDTCLEVLAMYWVKKLSRYAIFVSFFSVWLFSVLHGHSVFSSLPMISEVKGFLSQILSITSLSYLSSWVRASISLLILSAKQGNLTGTIFITSLVWRGPWLGIEPGTSRTGSQHSTTRLSRRLWYAIQLLLMSICKAFILLSPVNLK